MLLITYRFQFVGLPSLNLAKSKHPKGAFMFAVPHGHLFGTVLGHAWQEPYLVMASRSKDGDFAAFLCQKFGMTPVRASSRRNGVDKGGKEAIQLYISKLKQGLSGAITIDGPKGPAMVCKPGINIISAATQTWILPTIAVYQSYWEFKKSWDKFRIPKPFSKIIVAYGDPLPPPISNSSEDIAARAKEVDQALKLTIDSANNLLATNSK